MLLEYLESHDMVEAGACIAELQLPQYDYYIVKRALTVAADRKDRDREATSALLSHLYGQYVSPQQMQKVRGPPHTPRLACPNRVAMARRTRQKLGTRVAFFSTRPLFLLK